MKNEPTFRQQVRQEIYQEMFTGILSLFFGAILVMVIYSGFMEIIR